MNFLKKNLFFLLLTGFLVAVFLIPDLRTFVTRQILMKPALEKVEEEVTLPKQDLDIDLMGINVPNTNLKNLTDKAVFLNFWGSWCPPCRAEFPSIEKLYAEKGKKIHFVLIAMKDEEEKVRAFVKENAYTVPVYIAQSPIPKTLMPSVFPTTLILDKNQRIVKKDDAAADWNAKNVHEFIDNIAK